VETVDTVLIALALIAAVVAPTVVYLRLRAAQNAETERLMAKMEESLGASVKLLEVRNYYEQMSGELKKMLDEAFKEGNRFRQDHLRRLIERLEQLKARTLDRTTRLLENEEAGHGNHRRRRRGGRRGGQGQPQQQGRPQGQQGQQGRPPQGPQGRPQGQQPPPRPQQPPRQEPPRPQQPPRQEPPRPQPPAPEPPRGEKPPSTDPREEQSPSPFEE